MANQPGWRRVIERGLSHAESWGRSGNAKVEQARCHSAVWREPVARCFRTMLASRMNNTRIPSRFVDHVADMLPRSTTSRL